MSLNHSKRLIFKHLDKADVDFWSCSIIQNPIPVKHQVVQWSHVLRFVEEKGTGQFNSDSGLAVLLKLPVSRQLLITLSVWLTELFSGAFLGIIYRLQTLVLRYLEYIVCIRQLNTTKNVLPILFLL